MEMSLQSQCFLKAKGVNSRLKRFAFCGNKKKEEKKGLSRPKMSMKMSVFLN